MRKQENYWRRFEQTGGVLDYLNYTACARESYGVPEDYEFPARNGLHDLAPEDDDEEDEVEDDGWDAHREWDGTFGYANGRIR